MELAGQGIQGVVGEAVITVGSPRWLASGALAERAEELETRE